MDSNNENLNEPEELVEPPIEDPTWVQMHGFYADTEQKTLRFDVVMSFDVDRKEALETLYQEIRGLYPDYEILIVPDVDIAD